jgi:hypothetical protein
MKENLLIIIRAAARNAKCVSLPFNFSPDVSNKQSAQRMPCAFAGIAGA